MASNNYLDNIISQVRSKEVCIFIPEVFDSRILEATNNLRDMGFLIPNISDFDNKINDYANFLSEKKFTHDWPESEIFKYLNNPINVAVTALAFGDVDGVVAGATVSTADIIRAALRIVGIDKNYKWISSVFLMFSPITNRIMTYADCAVIPEPDSNQLAYIAKSASDFHRLITGDEPKVAFLSFSTHGSANHYRVERVSQATQIFSKKFPDIVHEGEIQFDAAISSEISKKKKPNSNLNGDANVFVFPNLDAGNISYKITQHLAGYRALGPFLQGLNKPVNDLSRGCSVEDIINVAAITAIQKSS